MKNIIVTGCAGFIGSHLCERLTNENLNIVGLDNLSNGKISNLKKLTNCKNFDFIESDINDEFKMNQIFKKSDILFHLAALADIVPSIKNPDSYFSSNVLGTYNIMKLCKEHNLKKIIYAASSSCYGIPKKYPTPENADINPLYPYALTKRLGEEIVIHFGKLFNIPTVSLRFFNVFGPRARTSGAYGAVFGVFLAQKLANKPFTVVGDGEQTRDFTYIDDVVNALIEVMDQKIKNEIFNVGSGETYSVNHLIKLLGGGKKIYIPKRPGEPDCTYADITKILEKTKWKPLITFEKGIEKLLENINDFQDAPLWDKKSIENETKDWFKYLT